MTDTHNTEEAIGWAGLRAMREAVSKAPIIRTDEDMMISVEIRMHSKSWPGATESGRSKSTLIGSAACHYSGKDEVAGD